MNGNELGAFLRSLRESVTPADVGLPSSGRRRTPGLRRSEVATLAGVSVEYLTRLEQGRDRRPSVQVLASLADALLLSGEQRHQLLILSKDPTGRELCRAPATPLTTVRPSLHRLLGTLEPMPAVVTNRLSDVLAATSGYERLVGPLAGDDGPFNLARFVFGDPRAQELFADWDRVADSLVADLRGSTSLGDEHVAHLVDELTVTAGATFADRWAATCTVPARSGILRLSHRQVGDLRLEVETLEVPQDDQRLVTYLPADPSSAAALDRLVAEPATRLRSVTS